MAQRNAETLRQQRLRLGLTLEEVVAKCAEAGVKVHNSQLSRIERGVAKPRPRLRADLARVLGLEVLDVDAQEQGVKA
ncbi:helix-turn-helix domain-containing protein [Streptomyces sp. NPDC048438]|uniref:helix-turn-helix domain-containing protein n=1 Tax=Streptomyces sp. NPDC048438 TaxID=3365551 RepID=UPI0037111EE1